MKLAFLKITVLLLIAFQSACSYKNNIKKVMNENRKILQTTNDTKLQNIDLLTPAEVWGQALGGVVGYFIAASNNGVVDISHASDPANFIKNELATELKSKYNLKIINGEQDVISNAKNTSATLSEYRRGNLVLDVYSAITGKYYAFRFSRYRIRYDAFVRLTDRETESVIFKSQCTYDKKKNNNNSVKEIEKNSQVMATILRDAQEFCLEKFKKEISR